VAIFKIQNVNLKQRHSFYFHFSYSSFPEINVENLKCMLTSRQQTARRSDNKKTAEKYLQYLAV